MYKYVDLHMHSSVSDGDKTPRELVAVAKEKNVDIISLTDHDSVGGISEAAEEAKKKDIGFIAGIELSCYDKKDTHVLGYNIDWQDEDFKGALWELQQSRMNRMEKMVESLRKDGFNITMDEVNAKCNGQTMGRPHIAAVMVEKGYGKDIRTVFNKYIGSGCRYYVSYKKLEVAEGINIIHKAGGLAVLAHPKLLRYNAKDFTKLIKRYKELGMDGIEVYYPCHYDEHVKLFSSLAKELDLLMTCGGDYHSEWDCTKNTMGFESTLPGIEHTLEVLLEGANS